MSEHKEYTLNRRESGRYYIFTKGSPITWFAELICSEQNAQKIINAMNAAPAWLSEIRAEQAHGRQKYGRGPDDFAHDDEHGRGDWVEYIQAHAERAEVASDAPMEWRQEMIKIAGLAISAIESFDRQNKEVANG